MHVKETIDFAIKELRGTIQGLEEANTDHLFELLDKLNSITTLSQYFAHRVYEAQVREMEKSINWTCNIGMPT